MAKRAKRGTKTRKRTPVSAGGKRRARHDGRAAAEKLEALARSIAQMAFRRQDPAIAIPSR
ncbi:MAG: hypothetical protein D6788_02475, partial [Planctomycetota bacterium]